MKSFLTVLPVEIILYLNKVVPSISKFRDKAERAFESARNASWEGNLRNNMEWGRIFEERWETFLEESKPLRRFYKSFYEGLVSRGIDPSQYMIELVNLTNEIFVQHNCWCLAYNWWIRPRTGGPIEGDYGPEYWNQVIRG